MQILSAQQVREWDQYTISHEPITSIDLMERASGTCVEWIRQQGWQQKHFLIFCGKGNNGGDGLAIARMLLNEGFSVAVYILEFGKPGSTDFQTNLHRLHQQGITDIHFIQSSSQLPLIQKNNLMVDCLYGSGLNKPIEGLAAELVMHLNNSGATILSIDVPSGLFFDKPTTGNAVIRATYTLSFQCYKTGLLVQENAPFIGEVRVLDIGLSSSFLAQLKTPAELLDEVMIRKIFRPRNRFAHKGTFGRALVVGGSYGKIGAVVLATKACLHSGAGLTTSLVPTCGYAIMQTALPEAMLLVNEEENYLSSLPDDMEKFSAIGIGPGIGTHTETQKLLSYIIRRYQKPMIIDADALNCLALNKDLWQQLPPHSILTPHPKEFDRLFGNHQNDFARMETAKQKAVERNIIIVLKGHHTFIALPTEKHYFNSTGNAGMAKGGSGDVLTGILTALLAQGYPPAEAAAFGTYVHGWAGDMAAKDHSMEAMLPSDIIQYLGKVFLTLQ